MEVLQTVLLVIQVFVSVTLIGFILIQHGKGADAGAAFGSGASSTVFGSQGSGNFLTRVTAVLAAAFLINSLALGYLATQREAPASIMEKAEELSEASMQEDLINILEDSVEKVGTSDVPEAPATDDLPELPAN